MIQYKKIAVIGACLLGLALWCAAVISFGSTEGGDFANVTSGSVSVARLTDTSAVVIYENSGTPKRGEARFGRVSGDSILIGSAYTFPAGNISNYVPAVCRLNDSLFAISYVSDMTADKIFTVVGIYEADTLRFTDSTLVDGLNVNGNGDVVRLNDTTYILVYAAHTNNGFTRRATYTSDGTVTLGDSTEYAGGGTVGYQSAVAITDTSFVFIDVQGRAYIGYYSATHGDTITYSPRFDIQPANINYDGDLLLLNDSTLIAGYVDLYGAIDTAKVAVGRIVNNDSIYFYKGTAFYHGDLVTSMSLAKTGVDNFVINYEAPENNGKAVSVNLVNDTAFMFSDTSTFSMTGMNRFAADYLTTNKYFFGYDYSGTGYLTIGTVTGGLWNPYGETMTPISKTAFRFSAKDSSGTRLVLYLYGTAGAILDSVQSAGGSGAYTWTDTNTDATRDWNQLCTLYVAVKESLAYGGDTLMTRMIQYTYEDKPATFTYKGWAADSLKFTVADADTDIMFVLYDTTRSVYYGEDGDTSSTMLIDTVKNYDGSVITGKVDTAGKYVLRLGGVNPDSVVNWKGYYTARSCSRIDSFFIGYRDSTSLTLYVADTTGTGIQYRVTNVMTGDIDTLARTQADGVVGSYTLGGLSYNTVYQFSIVRDDSGATIPSKLQADSLFTDPTEPTLTLTRLSADTVQVTLAGNGNPDSTYYYLFDRYQRDMVDTTAYYVGKTAYQASKFWATLQWWNGRKFAYMDNTLPRIINVRWSSGITKPIH